MEAVESLVPRDLEVRVAGYVSAVRAARAASIASLRNKRKEVDPFRRTEGSSDVRHRTKADCFCCIFGSFLFSCTYQQVCAQQRRPDHRWRMEFVTVVCTSLMSRVRNAWQCGAARSHLF